MLKLKSPHIIVYLASSDGKEEKKVDLAFVLEDGAYKLATERH